MEVHLHSCIVWIIMPVVNPGALYKARPELSPLTCFTCTEFGIPLHSPCQSVTGMRTGHSRKGQGLCTSAPNVPLSPPFSTARHFSQECWVFLSGIWCYPASQSFILRRSHIRIACAPYKFQARCRITVWKTIKRSEFQRQ